MNNIRGILGLPHFALDEIFKQLDWDEIIKVALCSKKARRVAKRYRDTSEQLFILAENGPYGFINICDGRRYQTLFTTELLENLEEETKSLRLDSVTMRYTMEKDGRLCTYWQDVFHGITTLLGLTMDFFECEVNKIVFNEESTQSREFMDFVMSRQDTIEICDIQVEEISDDDLKRILDICKPTETLKLAVRPYRNFRHEFNFETPKLHIENGYWLRPNNLISTVCQYIDIDEANFTAQDCRMIVTAWQNGKMPNLKVLQFGTEDDFGPRGILRGIDTTRHTAHQEYYVDEIEEIEFYDCHQLQRNDGLIATVAYPENDFRFTFLVWPDFNGTQFDGNGLEDQG